MSTHDQEPQYGQHRLPAEVPARPGPVVPPHAARRMVRGLSFTLVLLGVLLGTGLTAPDRPWAWAAGSVLVLPGLAGLAGVQTRRHPALRDPDLGDPSAAPQRSRPTLWLVPWSLLLLGAVPLAGTFAVGPALAGTPRAGLVGEYVGVLVVSGMVLVVAAAIGFALVATVHLTVPDDDDSPLRPTGYAGHSSGGTPGRLYDSEWIRGRHGEQTGSAAAPDDPGDRPSVRPPRA